jgi:hypothetical protein
VCCGTSQKKSERIGFETHAGVAVLVLQSAMSRLKTHTLAGGMRKAIFIVLPIAAVTACSSERPLMTAQRFEVGGTVYNVPAEDVEAFVADQGQLYVRLHRRGTNFKISYDSRSDREQRETGNTVITDINHFGPVSKQNSAIGAIYCAQGDAWNCGFPLMRGTAQWSVTFDRDLLKEVSSVKHQAETALDEYRS